MKEKKKCQGTTRVYARVTGFFSVVDRFNPGKQEEFKERNYYDVNHKRVKEEISK